MQCGHDIEIQWLAGATRFLRAVQHANSFDCRWQRSDEAGAVEGAEQPHLKHADLFTAGVQPIQRFFHRLATRAHENDDTLRVRRAMILEEPVLPPCQSSKRVHCVLNDVRAGRVERVDGFACLKIDIWILRRAAQDRLLRRQCASAMLTHTLLRSHLAQRLLGQQINLLDFVRGAKTVEEMHERNP